MIQRIAALLLILVGAVAGIGLWRQATPGLAGGNENDVVGAVGVTETRPPLGTLPPVDGEPAPTTTTRVATTTSTIPPLPREYYHQLSVTLPATASTPTRTASVGLVGPAHDPDREWNPAFGAVEVYQDERLAMPCEYGAVFMLGHANFSTTYDAWDFFYDVINSERYANDSGLEVGQQVVFTLDDGTELCRYQVLDLVEGPGEHLVDSPGRYFLKSELSGHPDDPTGGPDDQLIARAWTEDQPTLYLFGSYAGLSGNEMDATGVHQAYNWVVALSLVESPD